MKIYHELCRDFELRIMIVFFFGVAGHRDDDRHSKSLAEESPVAFEGHYHPDASTQQQQEYHSVDYLF